MAITLQERTNIEKLVVAMFNAAVGATYLADLTVAYESNGRSLAQLARTLAETSAYKALNPVFQTADEFATSFLTPYSLQANAEARAFIVAKFNAGLSKGQIAFDAAAALDAYTGTDTAITGARDIQNNKTAVAEYYSVTKGVTQTNVSSLQSVIASVTKDASSVTAAETAIDNGSGTGSGNLFTLTTGIDTFAGTSANDTFVASAATTAGSFNAADTLNGGAGTDTLNLTIDTLAANSLPGGTTSAIEAINIRNVSGNAQAVAAGNFAGATSFTSDRSANQLDVTGLVAGQAVGVNGNGSVTNGALNFTYGATVTAGTINISGGTTAGAITETGAGITSNTINSTGAANTVGAIVLSGTANTALTINAATALTTTGITGLTGTTAKITVAGAATSATTGVGVTLGTLAAAVGTVDASGMTAGGVNATLNTNTAIAVTGGAGNDQITTGSILTTGSVNAGAGTADRLTLGANTHIDTLALGNKYSGFEVVSVGTGGTTLDLDLLATNNTINGLRITGDSTVTNINAATAANVTVTATNSSTLAVKGALNPGQIDTVNLTVSDGLAAVSTFTLTAPTLAGVEILGIAATDNATVSALTGALALTNINVTGAANTSITTGTMALQTNFNVNAGTATGDLTFNATGATANGFSVTGSAGVNLITGGSQVFSANLAASAAKADVVALTNATGGTISLPNATISGFTNSATVTVGDKLDVIGAPTVQANVVAGTATGVTNLTGAVANGILTFAGTAAGTATLADKITAAASANFAGAANEVIAFEHSGNTYVVSQQATADAFDAGADLVVQLTGVTGVTALSATASGATTVWVA